MPDIATLTRAMPSLAPAMRNAPGMPAIGDFLAIVAAAEDPSPAPLLPSGTLPMVAGDGRSLPDITGIDLPLPAATGAERLSTVTSTPTLGIAAAVSGFASVVEPDASASVPLSITIPAGDAVADVAPSPGERNDPALPRTWDAMVHPVAGLPIRSRTLPPRSTVPACVGPDRSPEDEAVEPDAETRTLLDAAPAETRVIVPPPVDLRTPIEAPVIDTADARPSSTSLASIAAAAKPVAPDGRAVRSRPSSTIQGVDSDPTVTDTPLPLAAPASVLPDVTQPRRPARDGPDPRPVLAIATDTAARPSADPAPAAAAGTMAPTSIHEPARVIIPADAAPVSATWPQTAPSQTGIAPEASNREPPVNPSTPPPKTVSSSIAAPTVVMPTTEVRAIGPTSFTPSAAAPPSLAPIVEASRAAWTLSTAASSWVLPSLPVTAAQGSSAPVLPQAIVTGITVPLGASREAPASPQDAPSAPLPPTLPDAPVPQSVSTAPAFQMFAAALFEASRDRRGEPAAPDALAIATATTTATVAPAIMPAHAADHSPLDLTRPRWPEAMIERIELLRDAAADAGEARIRLAPDALGTVDVALRQDGDTLHVRFDAAQPETRAILADAQPRLAALAEKSGMRLGDSAVGDGRGGQPQGQPAPRLPVTPPSATRASNDPADDTDSRVA